MILNAAEHQELNMHFLIIIRTSKPMCVTCARIEFGQFKIEHFQGDARAEHTETKKRGDLPRGRPWLRGMAPKRECVGEEARRKEIGGLGLVGRRERCRKPMESAWEVAA